MWSFVSDSPKDLPVRAVRTWALAGLVLFAACSDEGDPVGPEISTDEPDAPAAVQDLGSLKEAANAGTLRVEVDLEAGAAGWAAREIEVLGEGDEARTERIEARVVAADAGAGSLTLSVGDLEVRVAPDAAFTSEDGSDVDRGTFFDALARALAAGERPGVRLGREAVTPPQAPGDRGFVASALRFDPGAAPTIELNVDGRHVDAVSDAVGSLTLLGLEIGVDLDGGSELVQRDADEAGAVELEGGVLSVDLGAGTLELDDGSILRIGADTRFEDGDDHLESLEAIASAVDHGRSVEVEAEAVREDEDLYLAVEIEAEVEENEFGGRVRAVDVDAGTFTVASGRRYEVTEETAFDEEGDLETLEAMAGALDGGDVVTVEGTWERDEETGARVALTVKVEVAGP